MSTVIPIVVVGTGMVVASITDVQKFKVYNNLTFPIFFAGLLFGIVQAGWGGFGTALAGAAIGFGILFIPYLMGGVGAGDVKFVMAMGSWIGPGLLLPAIIVVVLPLLVTIFS